MKRLLISSLTAISVASAAAAQTGLEATARFIDADGQQIGDVSLQQTDAGVLIRMELEGLPADGWVAFHIHENGTCNPDDDFESAGGHFAPESADHGFLVEGGPHAGDMPNQYIAADGLLRAHVLNTFVQLDGDETAIRGRSLVIHSEADDYESQPSGDAGDRIACGVIE